MQVRILPIPQFIVNSIIMEMEINIALTCENFLDTEFSLSIKGMKMSNREALRILPEKIEQSLIDCIELQYGKKRAELVKEAFSQHKCQDSE